MAHASNAPVRRRDFARGSARAILDATGAPIDDIETVALAEANGRVLASDVIARLMCRRFRAPAWTGTRCAPRDTQGATRVRLRAR